MVYDAANRRPGDWLRELQEPADRALRQAPAGRFGHTCDVVDFERFAGKDVLIIGGRQSAFESAALIAEAGARSVHLSYRHDTPRFERSDWSLVDPLMQRFLEEPAGSAASTRTSAPPSTAASGRPGASASNPGWAHALPATMSSSIPNTDGIACEENEGVLQIRLDDGESFAEVDEVLLATGYRVDLAKVPFLDPALLELRGECGRLPASSTSASRAASPASTSRA